MKKSKLIQIIKEEVEAVLGEDLGCDGVTRPGLRSLADKVAVFEPDEMEELFHHLGCDQFKQKVLAGIMAKPDTDMGRYEKLAPLMKQMKVSQSAPQE